MQQRSKDGQGKHLGFIAGCVSQQATFIQRAGSNASPFPDAVHVLNYTLGV